jgi:hypothetical protein
MAGRGSEPGRFCLHLRWLGSPLQHVNDGQLPNEFAIPEVTRAQIDP